MPALNLVSATLPADDKTAILAAIQTIKEKMPFLISLSDGNRSAIRTAASKRAGYIQDVKDAVKAFPEVLSQSFDREEFLRDNALSTEINEVTGSLGSLQEMLEDTRLQLSAELMSQSDTVYGYLKAGARDNNAVKASVEKIGRAFAGQGKRKTDITAKAVTQ